MVMAHNSSANANDLILRETAKIFKTFAVLCVAEQSVFISVNFFFQKVSNKCLLKVNNKQSFFD